MPINATVGPNIRTIITHEYDDLKVVFKDVTTPNTFGGWRKVKKAIREKYHVKMPAVRIAPGKYAIGNITVEIQRPVLDIFLPFDLKFAEKNIPALNDNPYELVFRPANHLPGSGGFITEGEFQLAAGMFKRRFDPYQTNWFRFHGENPSRIHSYLLMVFLFIENCLTTAIIDTFFSI